jgi:hypothetical protein
MKNQLSDDLCDEKQHHYRPDEPAGHELEFLPEAQLFPFAAKTDEAHLFAEGTLYALWIFDHRFLIPMLGNARRCSIDALS